MASAALRVLNARLQSIIDSAVDAVIVIDAKGRIGSFNRGAACLAIPSEGGGQCVSMSMPSPDRERHDGGTTVRITLLGAAAPLAPPQNPAGLPAPFRLAVARAKFPGR
jgi:hypothetical protein